METIWQRTEMKWQMNVSHPVQPVLFARHIPRRSGGLQRNSIGLHWHSNRNCRLLNYTISASDRSEGHSTTRNQGANSVTIHCNGVVCISTWMESHMNRWHAQRSGDGPSPEGFPSSQPGDEPSPLHDALFTIYRQPADGGRGTMRYRTMKNSTPLLAALLLFTVLAPAAGPPPKLWEALFLTPEPQRLAKLKEFIERGGDINAPVQFNRMLNAGERESDRKPTGWALDIVVEQARVDMVSLLLTNGASLHGAELPKAARARNPDAALTMITALLQAGADVNSRHDSFTALFWASSKGDQNTVKHLLAQPGIRIDITNIDGDTALLAAVNHGHVEIIEILVKAGADVRIANKRGETAGALAQTGLEKQKQQLIRQQAIINLLQAPPK